MKREAFTYRAIRRNIWRKMPDRGDWRLLNQSLTKMGFHVGAGVARAHSTVFGRSKYQPHQGKREMARRVRQLA